MQQTREQVIQTLCDYWVNAAQQPGGGFAIGAATEQHRLHRNGIKFHELSYREVQAACTGLSRVLLLKGLNTVIDLDHQLFWAWAGEMLLSPRSDFFSKDESELHRLFETCIRAALAGISPPPKSKEDWERKRELSKLVEFNTRQLVLNAHLVLAYLGLPLMEGLLKKVCSKYVDYSGKVVDAFDVPTAAGGVRDYVSGDPRKGKCSSLRDLMYLLYQRVADPDLRARLDDIHELIKNLDNTIDPFDQLYSWRNQSLHGQTSFPTIGGTLLNLAILFAFNRISGNYEHRRDEVWSNVQRDIETFRFTGHRSPWSYYPPF